MDKDTGRQLLLDAAMTLADGVASTFGSYCEVAVHDLSVPTHSLVHLANGHVTGRKLGEPIRDLISVVAANLPAGESTLSGYTTLLRDGRTLRSTTCILSDSDGVPAVAFCVNIDVTHLQAAVRQLGELVDGERLHPQPPEPQQQDGEPPGELLTTLIANVTAEFDRHPSELSMKRERLKIVSFLDEKGAFLIKGAVSVVADVCGVSQSTIYRDLHELRSRAWEVGAEPNSGSMAKTSF